MHHPGLGRAGAHNRPGRSRIAAGRCSQMVLCRIGTPRPKGHSTFIAIISKQLTNQNANIRVRAGTPGGGDQVQVPTKRVPCSPGTARRHGRSSRWRRRLGCSGDPPRDTGGPRPRHDHNFLKTSYFFRKVARGGRDGRGMNWKRRSREREMARPRAGSA